MIYCWMLLRELLLVALALHYNAKENVTDS